MARPIKTSATETRSVRLPVSLHNAIDKASRREKRTYHNMLLLLLERGLRDWKGEMQQREAANATR